MGPRTAKAKKTVDVKVTEKELPKKGRGKAKAVEESDLETAEPEVIDEIAANIEKTTKRGKKAVNTNGQGDTNGVVVEKVPAKIGKKNNVEEPAQEDKTDSISDSVEQGESPVPSEKSEQNSEQTGTNSHVEEETGTQTKPVKGRKKQTKNEASLETNSSETKVKETGRRKRKPPVAEDEPEKEQDKKPKPAAKGRGRKANLKVDTQVETENKTELKDVDSKPEPRVTKGKNNTQSKVLADKSLEEKDVESKEEIKKREPKGRKGKKVNIREESTEEPAEKPASKKRKVTKKKDSKDEEPLEEEEVPKSKPAKGKRGQKKVADETNDAEDTGAKGQHKPADKVEAQDEEVMQEDAPPTNPAKGKRGKKAVDEPQDTGEPTSKRRRKPTDDKGQGKLLLEDDSLTACKLGTKCYQKNPEHHKKYKHPQFVKRKCNSPESQQDTKKPKNVVRDEPSLPSKSDDSSINAKNDNEKAPSSNDNEIILPNDIRFHDITTDQKVFKQLFLVDMPSDFFQFYECLNQEDESIEKILSACNLELIGPFDLLSGKLPILENEDHYLIHWRFYYDVPEFQAILKQKGSSQYHIGYYRDSPTEDPVFLASNDCSKDCKLTPISTNIFAAVHVYLENEKKKSPFASMACQKLMDKIKKWAEQHEYALDKFDMKKRHSQMTTRTIHGAGIVVPYNKKTKVGYRPLVETDVQLRKMFKRLETATDQEEKDKVLSELQPVKTYADIAVDECDFGTGLEVGVNLFCSGLKELQHSALSSLCAVYPLLNRDAYSKIIQAHLKYRRKGPNMSVLK